MRSRLRTRRGHDDGAAALRRAEDVRRRAHPGSEGCRAPTCCEFGELPGGDIEGGNFVRPAIVVNPDPTLRVVTEEQFGPVIPIISVRHRRRGDRGGERHVGQVCAVRYGRRIPDAANRVGGQLVCGYVWVNDHGATRLDLRAPFGGMKASGIRSRAGHRRHPRLPGHALDRASRHGGTGRDGALSNHSPRRRPNRRRSIRRR